MTNAHSARMKKIRAYRLMLSICYWSLGFVPIFINAANIFDKYMLNIGKITPAAKAATIPSMNKGSFYFEYAKILLNICLSYLLVNSF